MFRVSFITLTADGQLFFLHKFVRFLPLLSIGYGFFFHFPFPCSFALCWTIRHSTHGSQPCHLSASLCYTTNFHRVYPSAPNIMFRSVSKDFADHVCSIPFVSFKIASLVYNCHATFEQGSNALTDWIVLNILLPSTINNIFFTVLCHVVCFICVTCMVAVSANYRILL